MFLLFIGNSSLTFHFVLSIYSLLSVTYLPINDSRTISFTALLRNDLYCVEWGVKLYSLTSLYSSARLQSWMKLYDVALTYVMYPNQDFKDLRKRTEHPRLYIHYYNTVIYDYSSLSFPVWFSEDQINGRHTTGWPTNWVTVNWATKFYPII